jgi:hypothetical protein
MPHCQFIQNPLLQSQESILHNHEACASDRHVDYALAPQDTSIPCRPACDQHQPMVPSNGEESQLILEDSRDMPTLLADVVDHDVRNHSPLSKSPSKTVTLQIEGNRDSLPCKRSIEEERSLAYSEMCGQQSTTLNSHDLMCSMMVIESRARLFITRAMKRDDSRSVAERIRCKTARLKAFVNNHYQGLH